MENVIAVNVTPLTDLDPITLSRIHRHQSFIQFTERNNRGWPLYKTVDKPEVSPPLRYICAERWKHDKSSLSKECFTFSLPEHTIADHTRMDNLSSDDWGLLNFQFCKAGERLDPIHDRMWEMLVSLRVARRVGGISTVIDRYIPTLPLYQAETVDTHVNTAAQPVLILKSLLRLIKALLTSTREEDLHQMSPSDIAVMLVKAANASSVGDQFRKLSQRIASDFHARTALSKISDMKAADVAQHALAGVLVTANDADLADVTRLNHRLYEICRA